MKSFLILFIFVSSLFSQILNGIVISSNGNPLYKARVTSELETVLTKKNGTFKINAVTNHLSFRAKGHQRKSINLDSYSALINMVHKITHKTPSKETLEELQNIANMNFVYSQFQTKV